MTDQSKYQIAIEAIRTKKDWLKELPECFSLFSSGEINVNFENVVIVFKGMFPGWHYAISESDFVLARIANHAEYFSCISEDDHFDPSPAKSLLIVMLMALEEMDKREAQS